MHEGKLITIHNVVGVPLPQQERYPLNRLPFYFPTSPVGDLNREISANHNEQQVIRRGTVSQFGGPDLEEISWEGEFFISKWYENPNLDEMPNTGKIPASQEAYRKATYQYFPSYFIPPPAGFKHYDALIAYGFLRDIMEQGTVVELRIQDRPTKRIELKMPVTIRNFRLRETGGEPDVRFYTITFRQYRFLTIRMVDRGGNAVNPNPVRPGYERRIPSPYTVKANLGIQDLGRIAYGRGASKWTRIVKANGGFKGMFRKGAQWRPDRDDGPLRLPKGTTYIIPGRAAEGVED